MKILVITGTRPELIRLSVILRKLKDMCTLVHIYTNQNTDPKLSTIFFKDLGIDEPNYTLGPTKSLGEFLGAWFAYLEDILDKERPDKILILGDTNSVLLGVLAAKKGFPIYHMEAGNRCYDHVVPEETNRLIIDSCSYINLPYNDNSKENLIREGHSKNRVFKTGNPIYEVLTHYQEQISGSMILQTLGLASYDFPQTPDKYILLSLHRTENVDNYDVAMQIVAAINKIAETVKVVFPMHPRTRDQFTKHDIGLSKKIIITDPLGFFDFVQLEKNAFCVMTDSGTVPEETSIFGIPCIVLRNTTERQELMECGGFILSGYKADDIVNAYLSVDKKMLKRSICIPSDYTNPTVSDTVISILMGQNYNLKKRV